jgi:hypothetical protein
VVVAVLILRVDIPAGGGDSLPKITTPIYIHPNSALYYKDPTRPLPEYVVYNELLSNQVRSLPLLLLPPLSVSLTLSVREKTRSTCLVSRQSVPLGSLSFVKIALCCIGFLLSQPKPFYDPDSDSVKCYVPSVYGAHRWELPPVVQSLQTCCQRMVEDSGRNKTEILTGYRKEDEIYR